MGSRSALTLLNIGVVGEVSEVLMYSVWLTSGRTAEKQHSISIRGKNNKRNDEFIKSLMPVVGRME